MRINPSAQAASRSVLAYLSIEPGAQALPLRQGLFAEGTLGTGQRQVLAVPVSALRVDKAQPYVQLLAEGQVQHRTVTPGARGSVEGEEMIEIDLPAGTQVLRGSVGMLRDGLPVRLTQVRGNSSTDTARPAP